MYQNGRARRRTDMVDRPTCIACGAHAPNTDTNYTLISATFGWRLTRRAVLPDGTRAVEWRCPSCWSTHKNGRAVAAPMRARPLAHAVGESPLRGDSDAIARQRRTAVTFARQVGGRRSDPEWATIAVLQSSLRHRRRRNAPQTEPGSAPIAAPILARALLRRVLRCGSARKHPVVRAGEVARGFSGPCSRGNPLATIAKPPASSRQCALHRCGASSAGS